MVGLPFSAGPLGRTLTGAPALPLPMRSCRGWPGAALLGHETRPVDGAYSAGTPAFLGAPTPYGDGATPHLDGPTPGTAGGGGAMAYSPALPSPAAGTPGAAPTPGTPGFDAQSPGLPSGAVPTLSAQLVGSRLSVAVHSLAVSCMPSPF